MAAGVVLFLALTALAIVAMPPEVLCRRVRRLDPRRWVTLALVVAAATISLFALGFTLQKKPNEPAAALATRPLLAGPTVAASCTLAHTTFASLTRITITAMARRRAPRTIAAGSPFPARTWRITGISSIFLDCRHDLPGLRPAGDDARHASADAAALLVSFFFNAVVLALAVNLLASLL
jgi:uncharacterized membrane protein